MVNYPQPKCLNHNLTLKSEKQRKNHEKTVTVQVV